MELKKQHIIEAALALFLEKGYPNTSMQEIAQHSNVSKATLYKFFEAKENLAMLVAVYLTEQMRLRVEKLVEQEEPLSRDTLRRSILVRMENFSGRNRFLSELLFSLTAEQREKYLPAINRNHFDIMEMFAKIIMRSFDLESEPLAFELTINLSGLIKEIHLVAKDDIVEMNEEAIADFIVDSLEAILEKRVGKAPLMTQQQLDHMRSAVKHEEQELQPVFRKKRLLGDLKFVLEDYEKNGRSGKLKEAEALLEELKRLEEKEGISYG